MGKAMRAWTAGVVAVALTSACGGGGGSGGEAPADQGALGSPEKVATRLAVGSLSIFFAPPASARKAALDDGAQSRPRSFAKAVTSCSGGGTRDVMDPYEADVDSPFSDETFLVEDVIYEECLETFDDGSSIVFNGLDSFSCPLSNSTGGYACSDAFDVYAFRSGSPQAPFEQLQTFTAASGAMFEIDAAYAGSKLDRRSVSNADGIQGRTRLFSRSYVPSSGTVRVNGGAPKSYVRSAGRPGAPVLREYTFEPGTFTQLTLQGYNSLVATGCNLGEYHLRTVLPLQYAEDDEGNVTEVVSGKVEVTQEGKTATAQITDNGLVVTDSDGQTATYTSVEQVRALLGDCLDFAAN